MNTLLNNLMMLGASMMPCVAFSLVTINEEGRWPATWPQEMEPLRKQARTTYVATGIQQQIHEIRFQDKAEFQRMWPVILKLRTPNAPVTLYWINDAAPKEWGQILNRGLPMARVHTPFYGSISDGGKRDKMLKVGPPWPSSVMQENGFLPEFVEVGEVDGQPEWIPTKDGKTTDDQAAPAGLLYRARIDLDLVADGEVINLVEVHLPRGTLVHSDRHPVPDLTENQLDALVHEAALAFRNAPKGKHANPTNEIPEEFWGPTIQDLKPLRVVNDRVNIKIVLSESGGLEGGFYVNQPISSFAPYGDYFFEYVPLAKGEGVRFGEIARYKMALPTAADPADD